MSAPVKTTVSDEKATLMILLPRELRDRFKIFCAANGRDMSSVLRGFMEDVLRMHSIAPVDEKEVAE